jgi:trans-aconitate methyltransferase
MLVAMGIVGRQFGRPAGLFGRIAGGMMARGTAAFNTALVTKLHDLHGGATSIADVGCGPGVGLAALIAQFPAAQVIGIDLSPQMLAQSRKRNSGAIAAGRLELHEGDVAMISEPVDLVMAVHVLYFWHDPKGVLAQLREVLTPDGVLALGYRCREEMPSVSQQDFPREGHRLYDSEEAVRELLTTSGFRAAQSYKIESFGNHLGWMTIGSV